VRAPGEVVAPKTAMHDATRIVERGSSVADPVVGYHDHLPGFQFEFFVEGATGYHPFHEEAVSLFEVPDGLKASSCFRGRCCESIQRTSHGIDQESWASVAGFSLPGRSAAAGNRFVIEKTRGTPWLALAEQVEAGGGVEQSRVASFACRFFAEQPDGWRSTDTEPTAVGMRQLV